MRESYKTNRNWQTYRQWIYQNITLPPLKSWPLEKLPPSQNPEKYCHPAGPVVSSAGIFASAITADEATEADADDKKKWSLL